MVDIGQWGSDANLSWAQHMKGTADLPLFAALSFPDSKHVTVYSPVDRERERERESRERERERECLSGQVTQPELRTRVTFCTKFESPNWNQT